MIPRRTFLLQLLGATLAPPLAQASAPRGEPTEPLRVGMSDVLVRGQVAPAAAQALAQTMGGLFVVPGRAVGQFSFAPSPDLARRCRGRELELCVVTGIEYGWLSREFPELAPVATAFTSCIRLGACLLVPEDSRAGKVGDLRGQALSLPRRSQFHTRLYLHCAIAKAGGEPEGYFSRVLTAADADEGIENVVERGSAAALVDTDSWRAYQERKPGRAKRLRVLEQSRPFPTAAVLCDERGWAAGDLAGLRKRLCSAHESAFTRQILNFWRISKFVPFTEEYQGVVKDILREVPQPVTPAMFVKE